MALMFLCVVATLSAADGTAWAQWIDAKGDTLVAVFDGGAVTLNEFREEFRKRDTAGIAPEQLGELKRDFLVYLVDLRVRELEAVRRGYVDENGEWEEDVIRARESAMVDELRRKVILPEAVTAEQVKALYEKGARRWLTRVILLSNKDEVGQVMGELESGSDFGELAEKWSLDRSSAAWKGVVAWVGVAEVDGALEAAIMETEAGRTTAPVETDKGVYIVKVDSIIPAGRLPFEKLEDDFYKVLKTREDAAATAAFVDSLAQALHVHYDEDATNAIVERFGREGWVPSDEPGRRSQIPDYDSDELQMTIVGFDGGSYTVDEYLDFVRRECPNKALYLAGHEEIHRGLRAFLNERLPLHLAYQMEMDKVPSVRALVLRKALETGVLKMLVDVAGAEEEVTPTEAECLVYYQENMTEFVKPGEVTISMFTAESEDAARSVARELEEGASYDEVVSRHGEELDGIRTVETTGPMLREENPAVFDVAFKMAVGEVSAPMLLPEIGYYAVIKLLDKEPVRQLSFEEAHGSVKNALGAKRMEDMRRIWNEFRLELREQYHVKLNPEALEQM
jgi:parvulin-like peptidyl-prolyl isomerase